MAFGAAEEGRTGRSLEGELGELGDNILELAVPLLQEAEVGIAIKEAHVLENLEMLGVGLVAGGVRGEGSLRL